MRLQNYALGQWVLGTSAGTDLFHAVTGEKVAEASSAGLDFKAMLDYARSVGGPKLRRMTFHQRALMLKEMARYLSERKDALYALSTATGATKGDSWIDIDGGIGTFFVYASKGRREFPNETFFVDGAPEAISKNGTFVGRHVCVPLEGVAVHINAFNFPVWGMMEKMAPSLLAGVPCIVKPATLTSFLTEAAFRMMLESRILPEGAVQLICGSAGDLLDHLECQDAVAFTGSASTGRMLKESKRIVGNAVRFNMEADSLNCSILGPDAVPGTDEFDLFVKEVVREMTSKAGQKCTAIRRTIVPENVMEDVVAALRKRLGDVKVGDPSAEGVKMGPLAGRAQVREVRKAAEAIQSGAEVVFGGGEVQGLVNADASKGAFYPITLLACNDPFANPAPHEIEAFGPVNTVMPYATVGDAIALARLGKGSLCGSLFTADDDVARDVVLGTAAYHGRLYVMNRHSAKEATGHGSPLPHLVHGGPGRAGGGEELGGVRGVMHYMQRTAVQGAPQTITRITNEWIAGADQPSDRIHPFRKYFEELAIGETYTTHRRTVTEADIVNFACLSGDHFYAHMDEIAARESMFGRRVAHGYFVIAAAAGLFVDPAPGPVIANYGMEGLRFTKPVYAGDTIQAKLTCKQKTVKETPADGVPQGVVAWDVNVSNQDAELVATYTILTLVRRK
ncbi:MAG TPA: phenylacetic acid degradation bifunctional protein PaaZ [Gemmatimonadaceae bacterium]|nr:MAG: phenylacetic acid degradation bifunctional protein PaaZ [Gemmatimonadetes bacterium SCN 70-22]HMN07781.1 phenylacetic acid degradation bifunctional protein PaaZ [Gemmatimonadaceae bacterium]